MKNSNLDKYSHQVLNSNRESQNLDTNKECLNENVCIEEETMKCPFDAKVIEDYTPSPYEHSCISLKKGQVVTVLEMKSMGKWYGKLHSDGRQGLFPFNRVQILN